ncbi:hypothetical protein [Winogradskya consettensis]|nr:hypothetical protein [Actinoplanes consettensis]
MTANLVVKGLDLASSRARRAAPIIVGTAPDRGPQRFDPLAVVS